MRRFLAWLGGVFGLAWLWRLRPQRRPAADAGDPAAELRARLAEAREAAADRDEFDASEGRPVDEAVEPPRSVEERRRAVHEQARQALGEMRRPPSDE